MALDSSAAPKKRVTLAAVQAAQPESKLGVPVWSPDGKRFIYLQDDDIRLYDVASRKERPLASLKTFEAAATPVAPEVPFPFEDRYIEEPPVQWSPDGRNLLIHAGGDIFEEPPVQWSPDGHNLLIHAGGDIFLLAVETGDWKQLTATAERERDPKFSPDGKLVAFRREHDLYVLEIASGKTTRLTENGSEALRNAELDWVYPEELGLGTAYWWAPDSKKIAYLQFDVSREPLYPHVDLLGAPARLEPQRYPRAGEPNADVRLGVVAVGGGGTRWMDLGEARDTLRARFYWLPDSSGIANERLNRVQNRLDLMIADAATGASGSVLSESDPYWINVNDHFRFLKGGKEFLWGSERDGFLHLYRYSIGGKQLARLTKGDWEVTSLACVDEKAEQIYYVSSEAAPLDRQLYRVGFDGGARTRLTPEPGTHSVTMPPDCRYFTDSFSSLTAPPRSVLRGTDGAVIAPLAAPGGKALGEYETMPSEIVPVKADDGTILYGRLIKPTGFDRGKKYPAVVKVYGGPGVQTVLNSWPGALNLEQAFAQNGYVVWMLDNRGGTGRGHKFETAVYRNLGEREVEDQKQGIRYLASLGFIDTKRVGVEGWSYGGYMTLRLLLLAPEHFSCGVAGAPVTDWRNYDSIYTERYMGLPAENGEGYKRSSNVAIAEKLKGALLIAHNLEDDNVLFQNTLQMADALERAGRQFRMLVYPGKAHHLTSGQKQFEQALADFFDACLQ